MKKSFRALMFFCAYASAFLVFATFEQTFIADAVAQGNGKRPVSGAAAKTVEGKRATVAAIDDETLSLYPTAEKCGECHSQIYQEWSSSNHAYASISPMFHKFEQKFQQLTQGTVGTFCVRCHQQVGTQLGESRETPLWERSQISREGVTCITCHRVKEQYGKVNGARKDLRTGLRQRQEERDQESPCRQGNLFRQNQP
jgi:Cytochrome c554 and c-prime